MNYGAMFVQVEKENRDIRFDKQRSRVSLRDGRMVYDGKDKSEKETDLFFLAKILDQLVGSVINHEPIGNPSERVTGRLIAYRIEITPYPVLYLTLKTERSWIRAALAGIVEGCPEEAAKRSERMCIDDILRRL